MAGRAAYEGEAEERSAFFTIALDRPGSDGGTDFIGITCFGPTARAVAEHIGKGHLVAIQGRLRSSRFEQDGQTIHSLDVIANRVEFLKAPKGSDQVTPTGAEDADAEPF